MLAAETATALRGALLAWFDREKRDLPWRKTKDPYAIWTSEIMLQQTRVETVVPYFQRFLEAFPTVTALAEAPLDRVLGRWAGLGYYRRARMLHEAAQRVVTEHGGDVPKTAAELSRLPGVGAYTAGAIASIAYDERAPLVDGNVARVFARLFGIEEDVRRSACAARAWGLAAALVPAVRPGDFNQALMELGATVCTPREPRCGTCPVAAHCVARREGRVHALPLVTRKAAALVERRTALVLRAGGRVLLARRVRDGAFGGMWEPPSVVRRASDAATLRALLHMVGLRKRDVEGGLVHAGEVVHVLTHRRLEVEVRAAALAESASRARLRETRASGIHYDALELVRERDLADRPLTTFARKLLRQTPGRRTRERVLSSTR
jgi:A/G-specific adenine glycosylase